MAPEICKGCLRTRRYHDAAGLCGLFPYDSNPEELLKVPNAELLELTRPDLASLVQLLRDQHRSDS